MTDLDELYQLLVWPEDLDSDAGRRRFESALNAFRGLTFQAKAYTLIDVAGGTGIGGIALAKAIQEKGYEVERLIITDLRASALRKAEEYSQRVLGFRAETYVLDAREVHKLNVKADVVLNYGNSLPHFSVSDFIKFVKSSYLSLKEDGILMIQGKDMLHAYLIKGYKEIFLEKVTDGKVLVSLHKGYDQRRGMLRRAFLDLPSGRMADLEEKFWDFGEVTGICELFFRNVKLRTQEGDNGLVICSGKRPPEEIISP